MTAYAGQTIPASILDRLENPPMFAGYQSAAQSIPNVTVTAVTMDSEEFDTYNGHSTVSNTSRYTSQFAGYYLVICYAGFAANSVANRYVEVYKNGVSAPNLGQSIIFTPTSFTNSALHSITIVRLEVADYVECRAFQNSGGALNTNPTQTGMAVFWMHA